MSTRVRFWLAAVFLLVFVWQAVEHATGVRGTTLLPHPWGFSISIAGALAAAFEMWRTGRERRE